MPIDTIEAQKWSEWLLGNSIKTFVTPGDYTLMAKHVEDQLKQYLPSFSMKVPEQREVARRMKIGSNGSLPKKYWLLKAPIDLAVGEPIHVK